LPPAAADLLVDEAEGRRELTAPVGELTVTRSCRVLDARAGPRCRFKLAGATGAPTAFELVPASWAAVPLDRPMTLRWARRLGVWFVEAEGILLAAGDPHERSRLVRVRELAGVLAPPLGWVMAAASVLVIAGVSLLRLRGTTREFGAIPGEQPAVVARLEAEREAHALCALASVALGLTPLVMAAVEWTVF
jgi:hypothetical protein